MIVLSRLQFVVAGLLHEANLFTPEDLAHLSNCQFTTHTVKCGMNALIVLGIVEFSNWSYTDHREARHDAERMPAEVRVVFLQDADQKLTGAVECGFFTEGPMFTKQLDYIRGW